MRKIFRKSIFEGKNPFENDVRWLKICLEWCEKAIEQNYYYKFLQNVKDIVNNKELNDKEKVDKISYLVNFCWGNIKGV